MKLSTFVQKHYQGYAAETLKPRTLTEYNRLLSALILPAFGAKPLAKLTTQDIETWYLKLRGKTPAQANRALAVLQAVLKLAARWGHVPVNPAHGISRAREAARERYLNADERQRFLAACDGLRPEHRAFLLLLYYTGARPGELLAATWDDVLSTHLEVRDGKTGRRDIYLSEKAQDVLGQYRPHLWCDIDTLGFATNSRTSQVFPFTDYRAPWNQVKKDAGLKDVRLYDLRHTFASACLSAGLPLETVSQLLGHTNPLTTRRYTHLQREAGNEAAAKAAAVL